MSASLYKFHRQCTLKVVVYKIAAAMVYYIYVLFASWVCCVVSAEVRVQRIRTFQSKFLADSPHWHERLQALFFVSENDRRSMGNEIHKYAPATDEYNKTKIDGVPGFIIPVEGTLDQFLVGVDRKLQVVRWDGKDRSPISVLKELGNVDRGVLVPTTFSTGKADPRGRVFAGTRPFGIYGRYYPNVASLFRLDGPNITTVQKNITVSDGLAWDLKEKAMYYSDSTEGKIRRYDYDVTTGNISNLTYIFDFEKNIYHIIGYPKGQTIDSEGNLFVAVFEDAGVVKIDPRTGKLLQYIGIPERLVTSVTFGGPDHETLFVTTYNFNFPPRERDYTFTTFKVTGLGVRGTPNRDFRL